jgi:hypothetical protein
LRERRDDAQGPILSQRLAQPLNALRLREHHRLLRQRRLTQCRAQSFHVDWLFDDPVDKNGAYSAVLP